MPRTQPSRPTAREYRLRCLEIADEVHASELERARRTGLDPAQLEQIDARERKRAKAARERTPRTIQQELNAFFPGDLREMSFGTFLTRTPEQEKASDACQQWVRRYADALEADSPRPRHGLALIGPNGRGKTHLAVAMLRELTGPEVTIGFQSIPELLARTKATYSDGTGSASAVLLDKCRNVDVLGLDDLGMERATEWAVDTLSELIGFRYVRHRPMIYTSNLAWEELERRADGAANAAGINLGAMYSRLRGHIAENVYYLDGEDYRAVGMGGSATAESGQADHPTDARPL